MSEILGSHPEGESASDEQPQYPSFEEAMAARETETTPEAVADVAPNNRQQEKILTYFIAADPNLNQVTTASAENIINSKADSPLEKFNIDPARINETLDMLKSGEINTEHKRNFLSQVTPNTTEEDWAAVKQDGSQRGIFAAAKWGNFSARDDSSAWHSETLVDDFRERYPSPYDYQTFIQTFLDDIEKRNGLEKRQKYEQASKDFRDHMYGKQNEYYDQLRLLSDEFPPETKIGEPLEHEEEKDPSQFIIPERAVVKTHDELPAELTPDQIEAKLVELNDLIDWRKKMAAQEQASIDRMYEQWKNSPLIDYQNDINKASERMMEHARARDDLIAQRDKLQRV